MTHRPRLLVLTSTYPRWSGDHEPGFVHELCRRLIDDFDVTVLCPHATGAAIEEVMDGVCIKRYRYAPTSLETLVNKGGIITNLKRQPWKWLLVLGFLLKEAWATWRLIRNWRPDVIHAHWLLPQGALIAVLGLIERRTPPFLVTSHGADLFALHGWGMNVLKCFVVRRATAVTVVSQAMRTELANIGADIGKVEIQPMGVDLTRRFTPDTSVARSRDEILFVGRLVEKKGLRYLIEAMPAILANHPNAYLTVAGFGPEEAALRSQVQTFDLDKKVNFIGAVSQTELPNLYRRAAVFVAPFIKATSGDQEGLGLVCIEAVGCGCPVIMSDLATSRDMFADVSNVVLVPQQDSSALALAVQNVLSAADKFNQCAIANRRQLIQQFDWDVVSQCYMQILKRLSVVQKHA
ncbi:MAG: glycosyltransferase [Gammaproteobacteria bacterium]